MLGHMADSYRDFPPGARPDVEVLVDGAWITGELRAWSKPFPTGSWWGNVSYRSAAGRELTTTVRRDRIRET
jgi:hypothetical protein